MGHLIWPLMWPEVDQKWAGSRPEVGQNWVRRGSEMGQKWVKSGSGVGRKWGRSWMREIYKRRSQRFFSKHLYNIREQTWALAQNYFVNKTPQFCFKSLNLVTLFMGMWYPWNPFIISWPLACLYLLRFNFATLLGCLLLKCVFQ